MAASCGTDAPVTAGEWEVSAVHSAREACQAKNPSCDDEDEGGGGVAAVCHTLVWNQNAYALETSPAIQACGRFMLVGFKDA